MSSPVRTESRDVTSILFLRPTRSSDFCASTTLLDSGLSSRHVSPIRTSSGRRTILFLLLVFVHELQPTVCAAGVAPAIERNRRTSEAHVEAGESRVPRRSNTIASVRSVASGTRHQPAVDSFTRPQPCRTTGDDTTHEIEYEPLDDVDFEIERKKITRREAIIHGDGSPVLQRRGKSSVRDAIFSGQRARDVITDNCATDEPSIVVPTLADRGRLMREKIGGFGARGLSSSRDENSSLDVEDDNWNGLPDRSQDSANEGFESSPKFSATHKPPESQFAAPATSPELGIKIAHVTAIREDSSRAAVSTRSRTSLHDAIFATRRTHIATYYATDTSSLVVAESSGGANPSFDIEDNWNGSSGRSQDGVNEGLESSPRFSATENSSARPVAAAPPTSVEVEREIVHEAIDKNILALDATFPAQRARRAEMAAYYTGTDASRLAVPTLAVRRRLTKVKRIGGFVAPVLVSRGDNSSSDAEDKWDGSSGDSHDGANDAVEGAPKFAEKSTYKPPAAAAPPGTPVEKYDRRHFGPPRMENPEEVSKETSEATGSSTAYARPSFAHFTAPSSTLASSFSSSSPILANLASDSAPLDVNDTRGSSHGNGAAAAAAAVDGGSRVQATREEDFYGDKKSNVNEAHVSAIDRLDDRVESTAGYATSTAHGIEPPQSSTAVLKLSEPERRKLVTMQPRVITGARGAPQGGTSGSRHGLVDKLELTILGLFELTQGSEARPEGPSELQAARLAVDRINDIGALPNIHLRLIHNDTRCDPGVAVDRFFHALYTSKNTSIMPLLLGTACSEVTETLAKIVPYWNIVQVSFGSTAPALSDPTEFPLFVRTVAPDSSHNPARISFIKHFGWDTVTALSQNGDMYSLAVNDLVTELEQANITCTATITFGENDYKEQLRTLKELDTRIIIGSFSPDLAPRLFCEAWKLGMHGGDYAWIVPGETIDLSGMTGDWWHSGPEDCTPAQLSQTLDGLIIVKSYGTGLAEQPSFSGLTTSEFTSELAKRGVTLSRYAGQTYDAVWSMALALGKLETFLNQRNSSIAQYSHSRKDLAYRLLGELKGLNFLGVSGPVSFDGADRVGITAFYQMHGHVVRRVALYTPEDGQLTMNCAGCARTRWPGEHPPVARRVFRFRMVTIDYAAFLAVACLASVGVTLALSFLAFNLHFRKHKSIKLSSPRLNNMAAVGCALVYGAVILLGLDHATLSDSNGYFPTICTARAYLLSAGFSLAFGSMFTKTYRVHRIFTRSRSGVVKNKLLQDTQLISLICVLLLIDGLVVTLWVTLDPMQRDLRNLTLEISSENRAVIFQPQVEVCRSQHTNGWLAALYAYKGLLLIVGVYMAWETRHVKIPALNDSQYIGMSVYSVVITSGIVVVLANLMSDRATLAFVTITTLILASTTATLALLFLPQLANILAGERADPVVQSLGLKIECNTRRFVTDDSRELQYRVEVQNRVYRREMAQLELELARLEKQLGQEPVEPSHASSSASIPQRNPSIGGGLPLLLLSVLPPVIPRASWPSADPSGMRRGTVAFSSQPDLEPDEPRRSLADIYKLQWRRDTEGPSRLGVFQRLFSLFGSRPSSRKTSTASFTGVASALRVHMGYIAGLVPGTKASSSCQVNVQGIRPSHPRCGSGPIISITSEEDRRLSLGLRRKESSEPRVNFSLPSKSAASQSSSRERIRGSPRFPHRIVPANSLSAIAPGSMTTAHQRWHSMEDASKQRIVGCTPRGSTYGPSFDVWAFREKAIPLSEFDDRTGGRRVPDSLALTTPSDCSVSPDDGLLGSDLRKLFRENSTSFGGSEDGPTPLDGSAKLSKLIPSPGTSPTKIITLIAPSRTESRATRTSAIDSVQDIQVSVGIESKHSQLSLSKSKVVVIRENNGHCVEPEFLLKAASTELSTIEAETIDEESSGLCDD